MNAPEVEGEEEDAMNASGYGDLSVHDVEEEVVCVCVCVCVSVHDVEVP